MSRSSGPAQLTSCSWERTQMSWILHCIPVQGQGNGVVPQYSSAQTPEFFPHSTYPAEQGWEIALILDLDFLVHTLLLLGGAAAAGLLDSLPTGRASELGGIYRAAASSHPATARSRKTWLWEWSGVGGSEAVEMTRSPLVGQSLGGHWDYKAP